jgi:hypothetical protein
MADLAGSRQVIFRKVADEFCYRILLRRSAMRVCHPGPDAFQRAMTSAGSRSEMSLRGFAERGRPPFFTSALASISEVSSGSSRYSLALTTCASTRARSDFKVRREALLFAGIGFPHAENVSTRARLDVTDHDQAPLKASVADDASFTSVCPQAPQSRPQRQRQRLQNRDPVPPRFSRAWPDRS